MKSLPRAGAPPRGRCVGRCRRRDVTRQTRHAWTADVLRQMIAEGQEGVEGSHIGRRLQGAISGTVDGARVRLRSSLATEGTQLMCRFDGRVVSPGQTLEGEVSLGESGKARWTARRVGQASA
jgi:hypothetical protein